MTGHLMSFTPMEVSGISTPVITQHLPTGAITYNASGMLNQIGGKRTRSGKSKKNKSKRSSKRSTRKHKKSHKRSKKH